MDWNDLRYLLAVHRGGSLARAAADLGVTKATVSRRIAALEESLGAQIVSREPTGMMLTEAGLAALEIAEATERLVSTLRTSPALRRDTEVAGVVKLTCPPWIAERLIIPALPPLRTQHPALELAVVGTHELADIAGRAADIALRNVIPMQGPLVCRRVGELAGCIYGSQLYLERRGTPGCREDLARHDIVAYEGMRGMPGFEWLRESPAAERIVFRAGDPVGLSSAILAGLGLGAIPCVIGETEPALRRIDSLGVGFSPLYLVSHEEARRLGRMKAVAQFVVEVLRANDDVLMGRGPHEPGRPP